MDKIVSFTVHPQGMYSLPTVARPTIVYTVDHTEVVMRSFPNREDAMRAFASDERAMHLLLPFEGTDDVAHMMWEGGTIPKR